VAGNLNTPGMSVAQRLLAVLDCFDVGQPELSLTEIATSAGLPLSTARRLVVELVRWGGLERLGNGHYRVGIRLWQIGSTAPRPRDLREAALPYMHDLYEATQENVQLVVLDGLEALCLEKISGASSVATMTEVGGRLPLHATGVGKVLLAFSPPALLRDVVRRGLPRATPRTIATPGRLAGAVAEVRRTGLSFAYEELTVGVSSVAAPISRSGDRPLAALGIVVRADTRLDRLAPALRTAALSLSRVAE
jgi:DNA-binding IclR family transcriptional regulator